MDERIERILSAIRSLPDAQRQTLLCQITREFGSGNHDAGPASQLELAAFDAPQLEGPADYVIVFDGGSQGNPGPAYGSYLIRQTAAGMEDVVRLDLGQDLTNNEAEYQTLIAALEGVAARISSSGGDPANSTLEIRGDSALVLRQVEGAWKAKDDRMRALRNRARHLLARFRGYRLVLQGREESVNALGH